MSNEPMKPQQQHTDNECTHCKTITPTTRDPKLTMRINEDQPSSNIGKAITFGIGAIAIGLVAVTIPFVLPAMRKHALPYIPATDKQVSNVFKTIKLFNESKAGLKYLPSKDNRVELIDLGSGDGRIVFEATKHGYKSTGVELNSMLVLYSKFKALTSWPKIKSAPYIEEKDAPLYYPRFRRADLWKMNMSEYDLIVVFGVQEMMGDLASKLKREMRPDCLIVSCRSPITEYKSIWHLDEELDSTWIYDKDSLFKRVEEGGVKEKLVVKKKKNEDDDDDLM